LGGTHYEDGYPSDAPSLVISIEDRPELFRDQDDDICREELFEMIVDAAIDD